MVATALAAPENQQRRSDSVYMRAQYPSPGPAIDASVWVFARVRQRPLSTLPLGYYTSRSRTSPTGPRLRESGQERVGRISLVCIPYGSSRGDIYGRGFFPLNNDNWELGMRRFF